VTPERALALEPEAVLAEVRAAGLRQKGGAGLLLAERWEAVRQAPGMDKVVICNAVDGDRRAQIARFVLRRDPRAVLEGLLIAARAVGAASCVVCVSAEYEDEAAALEKAAAEATAGAPSPAVRIETVPASLVGGEETALIRGLEGRQALPYLRAAGDVRGVGGAPTLVENAETLAAVAALLGEKNSNASEATVVAVFGDVDRPAIIEVSRGTTIAAAIESATGGTPGRADIKAVQFGGPAAPFLAGEALDTVIDHDDPPRVGCTPGWGGIEVFATGRCGVEMARDVTARLHEESCGKCVFCREGSRQMLDILNDVIDGTVTEERMELLHELGEAMKTGSICSLGWGAALPALSALELFAGDFKAHLETKRCPGGGR
jgi:NADH-quinone oxidoreductase subunit F